MLKHIKTINLVIQILVTYLSFQIIPALRFTLSVSKAFLHASTMLSLLIG